MRVGFVGLGNMGGPMARNLAAAGHDVVVFDLVQPLIDACVQAGASAASKVVDITADREVLVSMLPASQHVRKLYLDDGLLEHIDPKTTVIDCSTIAPAVSREVAAAAATRGIDMLDAPVSGGTAGAENATLTFIVGGDEAVFERCRALLSDMGTNLFHAGPAGAGQVAKVCNNMLLAVQMTATAEALALGVANGLDPAVLSAIMQQSSGGNWPLNVYNPWPGVMPDVPASRGYSGGFLVDLMIKDLELAMDAATDSGTTVTMGALARNLFRAHRKLNDAGAKDFSSIQLFVEPNAGNL